MDWSLGPMTWHHVHTLWRVCYVYFLWGDPWLTFAYDHYLIFSKQIIWQTQPGYCLSLSAHPPNCCSYSENFYLINPVMEIWTPSVRDCLILAWKECVCLSSYVACCWALGWECVHMCERDFGCLRCSSQFISVDIWPNSWTYLDTHTHTQSSLSQVLLCCTLHLIPPSCPSTLCTVVVH